MRATDESIRQGDNFIPGYFEVNSWETLKPYYDDLAGRLVSSVKDLEKWIYDRSHLEAVVGEAFGWRYINITRDSADEEAASRYQHAVQELLERFAWNIESRLLVRKLAGVVIGPSQIKKQGANNYDQ